MHIMACLFGTGDDRSKIPSEAWAAVKTTIITKTVPTRVDGIFDIISTKLENNSDSNQVEYNSD